MKTVNVIHLNYKTVGLILKEVKLAFFFIDRYRLVHWWVFVIIKI